MTSLYRLGDLIALWFCIALPLIYYIDKFAGPEYLVSYCLLSFSGWWLLIKTHITLSDKTIWIISGSGALFLVLIFFALYPVANVQIPGSGSDDDDVINVAVRELFSGRYPYYQLTYLGNGIHRFVESFIIGAPFVLAGTSALQNLFWFGVLTPLLLRMTGNKNEMLRFCLIITALSPIIIQQTATGSGHLANVIYVMVGMYWLLESNSKGQTDVNLEYILPLCKPKTQSSQNIEY